MVRPRGQRALARLGPPGQSLFAPNWGCDPSGVLGDAAVPRGCCVGGPRGAPAMLTPSLPRRRRPPLPPPTPQSGCCIAGELRCEYVTQMNNKNKGKLPSLLKLVL